MTDTKFTSIAKERIEELEFCFFAETNDPETEEWRDDLTPEEAALVAEWDKAFDATYCGLVLSLDEKIRQAEEIKKKQMEERLKDEAAIGAIAGVAQGIADKLDELRER